MRALKNVLIVSAVALAIPAIANAQIGFEPDENRVIVKNEEVNTFNENGIETTETKRDSVIVDKDNNIIGEKTERNIYMETSSDKIQQQPKKFSPEDMQKREMEKSEKIFETMDANSDGMISKEEFMGFHKKMHEKRMERMHDRGFRGPKPLPPAPKTKMEL